MKRRSRSSARKNECLRSKVWHKTSQQQVDGYDRLPPGLSICACSCWCSLCWWLPPSPLLQTADVDASDYGYLTSMSCLITPKCDHKLDFIPQRRWCRDRKTYRHDIIQHKRYTNNTIISIQTSCLYHCPILSDALFIFRVCIRYN